MAAMSTEGEALYSDMISETEGADEGMKKLFFQDELEELPTGKGKGIEVLMKLVQELVSAELLRTSKTGGRLCWSVRAPDAAKAIRSLSGDEKMVYGYIEDAQEKGIWVRDIRKKSNLHNAVVDKAIRKLENSRLIKGVKNVKHPAQKTYVLFHLEPSDEITGGSFFDGGDLDRNLVEELSNLIIFHVHQHSWARMRVPKRDASPNSDEEPPRKSQRKGDADGTTERRSRHKSSRRDEIEVSVVYPAYSHSYPTCESIHKFIVSSGALRDKGSSLSVTELQNVIDVLVWDDKLENISGGYRTVRGVNHRPTGSMLTDIEDGGRHGNGLTQAPCWRCPVFDLCGDTGPVSASTCVYFKDWLEVAL